jgi:hypothetical protein
VTLARLSVAAALLAAAAPAAAAPPFPHAFHGTVSGTFESHDTSQGPASVTKGSWTVDGLRLRLNRVVKTETSWLAYYVVTAGTITYHEHETGWCSYDLDTTVPARTSLDKSMAPLALSQSLFLNHKTTMLGGLAIKRTYKPRETCGDPGNQTVDTKTFIGLRNMFDPAEKVVTLGKPLTGRNSAPDNYQSVTSTMTWRWSLKPGR